MSRVDQVGAAIAALGDSPDADLVRRTLAEFDVRDIAASLVSTQGAGGGSLPQGWVESGDPADVQTNGGGVIFNADEGDLLAPEFMLKVGSTLDSEGVVEIGPEGLTFTDGDDSQGRLFLRGTATDQPLEIRARPATDCILITDGDVALSAMDCGNGRIINVGAPEDSSDAARLDSLGAMADYAGKPEIPATPNAQDVVTALVALGLVTQAAP